MLYYSFCVLSVLFTYNICFFVSCQWFLQWFILHPFQYTLLFRHLDLWPFRWIRPGKSPYKPSNRDALTPQRNNGRHQVMKGSCSPSLSHWEEPIHLHRAHDLDWLHKHLHNLQGMPENNWNGIYIYSVGNPSTGSWCAGWLFYYTPS